MPIYRLGDLHPAFAPDCWIAPDATLIGDVRLGRNASVWFQTVIRADNDAVIVGAETNIQDRCVLHVDPGVPLTLGQGVTVGHGVILHGCTVGDHSLIGINSVILNNARVGAHCLIGANSLVTEGQEIPDRSLVMGSPARVIRPVSEAQLDNAIRSAARYVAHAGRFAAELTAMEG